VEASAHPPGGLAYEELGEGTPVLLVHGTGVARGLWRETNAALPESVRAIAYDRRAYGESGAPEPYGGTTVEEQAEDAAALLRALEAAPAMLCGHELGALVCLDVARRHPAVVTGMVLVEPPLLSLSPEGPAATGSLRERMERGAREGGPAGAVDALLEALGGPGTLERLGPDRLAAARAAARAVAADLAAGPAWGFTRRGLRALGVRAVVVSGTRTAAVRREVAESLAATLGAPRVDADAGHFVPLEAPEAVAAAVTAPAGGSAAT
jgi:pimeloyl-ACP methyl ester carboxylesterase